MSGNLRDPNHVPTVAEALADPAGFVAGMTVTKQTIDASAVPPATPKFAVGTRVLVERYMGLLAPDFKPSDGSKARPVWCRIIDIRLQAKVDETDDEQGNAVTRIHYPKGWQYYLVRETAPHDAWGWEPESALLEKGYKPFTHLPDGEAAVARACQAYEPLLRELKWFVDELPSGLIPDSARQLVAELSLRERVAKSPARPPTVPQVLQGGIGESWRKVWRGGFAPAMSTKALVALRDGLKRDDPRITQGSTTTPPPLMQVEDWPVEACDAISFAGWQAGETDGTVGGVKEYHARLCVDADTRVRETAACRWFLNWFDDTPRPVMIRELLAEVELALKQRTEAAV